MYILKMYCIPLEEFLFVNEYQLFMHICIPCQRHQSNLFMYLYLVKSILFLVESPAEIFRDYHIRDPFILHQFSCKITTVIMEMNINKKCLCQMDRSKIILQLTCPTLEIAD